MQMKQRDKRPREYDQGDLVSLAVPRIDRKATDRPTLPCKVLEVLENGLYRLGCRTGVLGTCYSAAELQPLGVITFPELDDIPSTRVSVRQAAQSQACSSVTGVRCACRKNCNDARCKCKKAGVPCNSGCHPSSKCSNCE
jgi:hypothetical protein